jgi:hypothetical protein
LHQTSLEIITIQVDFSSSKNIQGSNSLPDDVIEHSLNDYIRASSISKRVTDTAVKPDEREGSTVASNYSYTYQENTTSPTSPSSPHSSISEDNNKNIEQKDVPNRPDRLRLDHSKHAHIYNNEDADDFESADNQEEQGGNR